MYIRLYYSSLCFGLTAIHAFYIRHAIYTIGFIAVMASSILTHTLMFDQNGVYMIDIDYERRCIQYVDRIIAHYMMVYNLWDAIHIPLCMNMFIYWICAIWIIVVFYTKCEKCKVPRNPWHVNIHIVSMIGMYFMFLEK